MVNAKFVMSILAFQFIFSTILADITGTIATFLSPVTLTIISIPLIAVIAVSNTPIGKGVAMATFFGVISFYMIFSNIPIPIFALVIIPLFIGLGLAMAEIGQG
jgi:hypothetical protein